MGATCSCTESLPPQNPNSIDLSHFELLKVVGKGGFGKVQAVMQRSTGELFAMKRIHKFQVLESPNYLRIIWIERKVMSSFEPNQHLVYLVHAFQNERELFLVMPFMEGGDLRYQLSHVPRREQTGLRSSAGGFAEFVVRFYTAQIIIALAALHRRRLVYRDLKPDNMLLDAEGYLWLSDFGLATALKREHSYMTTGDAGTRGYQSPEQLAGSHYDASTDVWSFGIVVYELLHGAKPFKDLDQVMMAGIITAQTTRGQSHRVPGEHLLNYDIDNSLSTEAHDLIRRLLNPDSKARLGCGAQGWGEVTAHPFYRHTDWEGIQRRTVKPPIVPDASRANCTADADLADQLVDRKPRAIQQSQQSVFANWDFNTEISSLPQKHDPPRTPDGNHCNESLSVSKRIVHPNHQITPVPQQYEDGSTTLQEIIPDPHIKNSITLIT